MTKIIRCAVVAMIFVGVMSAQQTKNNSSYLWTQPQFFSNFNNVFIVDGYTYPTVGSAVFACLNKAASQLQTINNGGSGNYPGCDINARGSNFLPSSVNVLTAFDPAVFCSGVSPSVVCSVPASGSQCVASGGTCNAIPMMLEFADAPYSLTGGSITLESGFFGWGVVGTLGTTTGAARGTVINCALASAPCFRISPNNNQPAQGTILVGLGLTGAAGNTSQECVNLDASSATGTGLWYATWINVTCTGFKGVLFDFNSRANDNQSNIQGNVFINLRGFRMKGGGYILREAGAVSNNTYIAPWFVGQGTDYIGNDAFCDSTGSALVYLGANSGGTQNVNSENFISAKLEGSDHLADFAGAQDIHFDHLHSEGCAGTGGVYTNGMKWLAGGSQNKAFTIDGSSEFLTIGIAPSTGFLFDTSASGNSLSLHVRDTDWGQPTTLLTGSSLVQDIDLHHGNFPGGALGTSPPPQKTTNVIPTITVAASASGNLVLKGPSALADIAGTGNVTNIVSSATPKFMLTLRATSSNVTFWNSSQSAAAISSTAYDCTISSNTLCNVTLANNLPNPGASGVITVTGANFTGSCTAFNTTPIILNSATSLTTVVIPAPVALAGTASTCGSGSGSFTLISNLKLGGRSFLTTQSGQALIFVWNDATSTYDCLSCDVAGEKVGGPFSAVSNLLSGFQGDSTVAGFSGTLPDGNVGECVQIGRQTGAFDSTSHQPTFAAGMFCAERISTVATLTFWMTDAAILSGNPVSFASTAGHSFTLGGSLSWNAGSPFWNFPTGSQVNGKNLPVVIASGTSALGTGAITTGTCATVVTTAATGTLSTDAIDWNFNAAPGTGWPGLHITPYVTADNVNFLVCNGTAGSLTPAAATLNWKVLR